MFRETVSHCRKDMLGLMVRDEPYKMRFDSMDIYECKKCGHIQAEYQLSAEYYNDYQAGAGQGQYYGENITIDKLLSKLYNLSKGGEIALEIGSGAGTALIKAGQYFSKCIGVDPSERECIMAENAVNYAPNREGAQYHIICDYFGDETKIEDRIDAFYSLQTFEHIENLKNPLKKAYSLLNEYGVGLINVPNGMQIFENALFHQVLFEHINYFTPNSIATLCMECGFEIVDIEADMRAIELNVFVRKKGIRKKIDDQKKELQSKLNTELEGFDTVGIYGAGAKTVSFSTMIDISKVVHIFDGDRRKIGKYYCGLPIKVEQYGVEIASECDTIIIFASSYNDEIIRMLKENGYEGKILYFENMELMTT